MLKRAISSIRRSSVEPIRILVVVNGSRNDVDLCSWLKEQPDVVFEYQHTPSAPQAVYRGRELVETEFFSTLDDDDEYLDGATDQKLLFLRSNLAADLVVTNGYRLVGEVDKPHYSNLLRVARDPLGVLMQFNWLHSGNALYRTTSVELFHFSDSHPYAEWTWLAFKLAMASKKIGTLESMTFKCYDTPLSLSKTAAYSSSYLALFERMLGMAPEVRIAKGIKKKISAYWHDASVNALDKGQWWQSLRCHLRGLFQVGGSRYLSYSRHLLIPRRTSANAPNWLPHGYPKEVAAVTSRRLLDGSASENIA